MRPNPLLLTILSAIACDTTSYESEACFTVEADVEACPAASDVDTAQLYLPNQCGDDLHISSVDGEGVRKDIVAQSSETFPSCCYPVTVVDTDSSSQCVVGRPYVEGSSQRSAKIHTSSAGLTHSDCANAWLRAGALEHASVAAFARLSLQLMACGAPNALLTEVHQAAVEETEHAEACWKMARKLGVDCVVPGPFPFGEAIELAADLARLAADTVREGCLAETLGAHLARVAADAAPDLETRAVLQKIAADEARHAALSFRIVAWALRAGDAKVREAVMSAFAGPLPQLDIAELALRANIDSSVLARAARAGVDEVIRPAAITLMAA